MEKYQISEDLQVGNTAGGKAPSDIERIVKKMGYKSIVIHRFNGNRGEIEWITSRVKTIYEWFTRVKVIPNNAILFLQLPIRYNLNIEYSILKRLKMKKHIKIIAVVHDVEKLRVTTKEVHFEHDFQFMLHVVDVLIVHNESMKRYFIKYGFPANKIVNLEIFDYLDSTITDKDYIRRISIAGNLDPEKAKYISRLKDIRGVHFDLFGLNFNESISGDNIQYRGLFPPDKLTERIAGTFGLVWDGDSIDSCEGIMGNYLRYNNPHKLSLYLSSGIPVVVWSESAEAYFVKDNKIGICISSLHELNEKLSEIGREEYDFYRKNVITISKKLAEGYYIKKALANAEMIVRNE